MPSFEDHKHRSFDVADPERRFRLMRVRRAVLGVAWTGIALAGGCVVRAQEATSANLPDQFQTDEMIQVQKPKKKKTESNSQTLATAPNRNVISLPEQSAAGEELPPLVVPSAEKKVAASPVPAGMASSQTPPPHPIEQSVPSKESPPGAAPVRKPRMKKRPQLHVESEMAGVSETVPMSLSVAQSMAISAPLPEYTFEAKRRNLTGSGICLVSVDAATGRVIDARMFQSTGSAILDKITTQTFKIWRFKPGTVSQVRVPISYE